MSTAFLRKYASRTTNSSKSKQKAQDVTHLYMNDKNLEKIDITVSCDNLKVLYLHNNRINTIVNLEKFLNLSHLYLQWNRIQNIENLNCLRNLQKLYLGYNMIKRLENIERLQSLKELHIEKQDIGNANFTFDFFTLKSIARNLEVLNISQLGLMTLEPISILLRLKHLIANGNQFQDAEEIGHVLGRMIFLEKADIQDCPAQKDIHYREKITAGSYNLQFLNGKFITPYNRTFIKRFEEVKNKRRTKSDTDTKQKPKAVNRVKPSAHSLQLQNTTDEMTFRAWNSLNSAQKPMRRTVKKEGKLRPKSVYSLEGRHIVKEKD
ncbi:unnamed protein product [Hermetia illucens]|uniref:Dynein axonemal assembly factor 1 homolog n=1 Tax=Hermetia illucens TaxID=343691 RepID=A0A7R8UBC6_HERIL|nr:protein phosphatase 1 regulatory subunit 42-like [Hermetia illucens]CAD7077624.1 unnamed protein product [Hermetia illucens]